VNGRSIAAELEPRVTLLDFVRDRLGLTGTKKGCNEGAFGTCTVLIDGSRMNACLTLAVQCEGHEVRTIDGIANSGKCLCGSIVLLRGPPSSGGLAYPRGKRPAEGV
jgi:aerobic-type carbon monoxide dehydrogenase small subunit (CoxS/CutS family)